jgi:putative acetyltransferase
MEIRRYRPGEERAIRDVFYGSMRNVVSRDYTPEQVRRWAPDDPDMERWREKLSRTRPFVAVLAGRIIGFAELEPDGHIDRFYCHHEHQRQGVGSALMAEILAEAKRSGLTRLYAEVSVTALPFFLAKGFEVDKETNEIRAGSPAKQYHMIRPASGAAEDAPRCG